MLLTSAPIGMGALANGERRLGSALDSHDDRTLHVEVAIALVHAPGLRTAGRSSPAVAPFAALARYPSGCSGSPVSLGSVLPLSRRRTSGIMLCTILESASSSGQCVDHIRFAVPRKSSMRSLPIVYSLVAAHDEGAPQSRRAARCAWRSSGCCT